MTIVLTVYQLSPKQTFKEKNQEAEGRERLEAGKVTNGDKKELDAVAFVIHEIALADKNSLI